MIETLQTSPLAALAQRANEAHRKGQEAATAALEHYYEAGKFLTEAKEQIPHGGWLMWLEANFESDRTTAFRYMTLYKRWDELGANVARVQHLSLRGALDFLSEKKEEADEEKPSEDVKRLHSAVESVTKLALKKIADSGLELPTARHAAEELAEAIASGGIEGPDGELWPYATLLPSNVVERQTEANFRKPIEIQESMLQRRADRIAEIKKNNRPLEGIGKFSVIYADPPWQYEHVKTENRAIENHYPTMTLDEICELPVSKVAAEDAALYLWVTSPKVEEGLRVINEWGFTYRTCLVWVKDKIGMGYYARQKHELLFVATRGSLPVPEPQNRYPSVIEAPRLKHSAKPEVVYTMLEAMYPEFERLELFARAKREGWHTWGNQA